MEEKDRLIINIIEAGKLLGISRGLAYRLANQGKLHAIRLGRRLVIPKAAFEKNARRRVRQKSGEGGVTLIRTYPT